MKHLIGYLVVVTIIATLAIPFAGCDSNSLESRLVKASEVLPQTISFENLYVDVESPKRSVVTSTISVSISEPEDFARDVVMKVLEDYSEEDLKELAARPFIDLGIPRHDDTIPDSLASLYNAWLIGVAGLAYSGKESHDYFSSLTRIEGELADGSRHRNIQIESDSSVVPTEYGDVVIAITYDYDSAPKGMISVD